MMALAYNYQSNLGLNLVSQTSIYSKSTLQSFETLCLE